MNQLILVALVFILVAFLLIKNLKFVIDKKNRAENIDIHEKYARFSASIQKQIRAIKKDINSEDEETRFALLDEGKKEDINEFLSDNLRKLVFYETLMSKQKSENEIQSDLFAILSSIDELLKDEFKNGEDLADELREDLQKSFEA